MKQERLIGQETFYPHAFLHSAAKWCIKRAETSEEGADFAESFAILASAFFVEAYLNHAGAFLFPETWQKQKDDVGKGEPTEWDEPKKKLKTICMKVGYRLDCNSSEYSSFNRAFQFRKRLVHAKTYTVPVDCSLNGAEWKSVLDGLQADSEKEIDGKAFTKIVQDCENLVLGIHKAVKLLPISTAGHQYVDGDDPFGMHSRGIFGIRESPMDV
jgi:hypothetical protein